MENALALVPTQAEPVDDAYLTRLIGYYDEAMEASQTAREKAERDRDYYDGKQFTDAEMAELERRGQPPVSLNLIASRVDYLLGLEKKARGDPKGFPRTPQDQAAADAFTDGMRFVIDQGDYPSHRSAAYRNVFIEGYGGVEWTVVPNGDDFDITPIHIPWDRLIFDPHSAKADFSDAAYLGQVLWLDLEDAVDRAVENGADEADARSKLESTLGFFDLGNTYDDKPKWSIWANKQRKRVRVVSLWHKERGRWKLCEFTKGGVLWEMDGPYADKDGDTYCPLVIESFKVDRDNNRYGPVRDLIDPQDEENKRRSKALHLLSVQGVVADEGAVENVTASRKELAKPDFWITKTPNTSLEIIRHTELAAGHVALAGQAREYILQQGANAALQGRVSPNQSGRAIEAQQSGGLVELGDAMDSLRRFDRRCYRIVAAMMQQFWSSEKWVRVTDDELAPQYVGLNVPLYADQMSGMVNDEQGWQEVFDQGGQPQLYPATNDDGSPMLKNSVAELDVDIIVAESPDTINSAPEAFQAMMQVLAMQPPPPPHVQRLVIEMNPALTAKMKKKLLGMVEQASQQPNPMQELGAEKAKADVEKTRAEGFRTMAQGEEIANRAMMPPVIQAAGMM